MWGLFVNNLRSRVLVVYKHGLLFYYWSVVIPEISVLGL